MGLEHPPLAGCPYEVGAGAPSYPNVRNVLGMITCPASKITDERDCFAPLAMT